MMNFLNCNIWNNYPNEIEDKYSNIEFNYGNIQGGWEGVGNIDSNPLFCEPDSGDYFLAENSPCVGTGIDGANMGAFGIGCDALSVLVELTLPKFTLFPAYPNPFNPTTTIRFINSVKTWHATSLHIYDITGHLVATLVNGKIETGFHEIQWDASFVASGVYFVELTLDNQ
jgi:hypothetical protein